LLKPRLLRLLVSRNCLKVLVFGLTKKTLVTCADTAVWEL